MLLLALVLTAEVATADTYRVQDGLFLSETFTTDVLVSSYASDGFDVGIERVAEFDAKRGTWSFEPGYDMDDVGLVLSGQRATKTSRWTLCGRHGDTPLYCDLNDPRGTTWIGEQVSLQVDQERATVFTDERDIGIYWAPTPFLPFVLLPTLTLPPLGFGALGDWAWWFTSSVILFLLLSYARRNIWPAHMSSAPAAPPAPTPPDGLLDSAMTTLFGRSWRTGVTGFLGVALSVAAVVSTVDAPVTWQKLAPLLPGLAASLGLMVAKDGKVSGPHKPPDA